METTNSEALYFKKIEKRPGAILPNTQHYDIGLGMRIRNKCKDERSTGMAENKIIYAMHLGY